MRVAFLGNTCNYAYWMCRWCHLLGVEASLYVAPTSWERDHPSWDDPEFPRDHFPDWVHTLELPFGKEFLSQARRRRLYEAVLEHDVVHSFSPDFMGGLIGLGRPLIYHSIGALDYRPYYLAIGRGWSDERGVGQALKPRELLRVMRMRRILRSVEALIVGQPYELPAGRRWGGDRLRVLPNPYGLPALAPRLGGRTPLRFFAPARQYWWFKGNDLLLRSYAAVAARHGAATPPLVLLDWGPDCERSRELASALRLTDRVEWLPMMPRPDLLREMRREGTIVVDQFSRPMGDLASFGGVGRDALAAEAPLLTHISSEPLLELHEEVPPVLGVDRPEQDLIVEQMERALALGWPALRCLGEKGRSWLEKECGWATVMPRYLSLYSDLAAAATPSSGA